MKISPRDPCPCGRQARYAHCCGRLHEGAPAASPENLMRSRYAAYALGLVDYILATTDPEGPMAQEDEAAWRDDVGRFCRDTRFLGLEVHSASAASDGDDGDQGEVTFTAKLAQRGRDATFTEKSRFRRVEGHWLYVDGDRR